MEAIIKLEGNSYVVYENNTEEAEELFTISRSEVGDQVAKRIASAYLTGYVDGFNAPSN